MNIRRKTNKSRYTILYGLLRETGDRCSCRFPIYPSCCATLASVLHTTSQILSKINKQTKRTNEQRKNQSANDERKIVIFESNRSPEQCHDNRMRGSHCVNIGPWKLAEVEEEVEANKSSTYPINATHFVAKSLFNFCVTDRRRWCIARAEWQRRRRNRKKAEVRAMSTRYAGLYSIRRHSE